MMTVRNPKTLIISKYFQLIIYAMAYMYVAKNGNQPTNSQKNAIEVRKEKKDSSTLILLFGVEIPLN